MQLKITNRNLNKNIDQISGGELFIVSTTTDDDNTKIYSGVFMKLNTKYVQNNKNAIRLNDGTLWNINTNMILHIINGELII